MFGIIKVLALSLLPASLLPGRVIVISVDGLRPDAVTNWGPQNAPNFHRLRNEGAFADNARTDVDYTTTLPNHTSMITGRPVLGPCGHQLTVNSGGLNTNVHATGYKASMFDVAHDHGLSTALFAGKTKFGAFSGSYDETRGAPDLTGEDNGRDKIDVFQVNFDDALSVANFTSGMQRNLWDLSLLHIRLPDSAGHSWDWNVETGSNYMNSIKVVDGFLGQVFELLDTTPALTDSTYLILTTDHGGTRGTRTHTNPFLVTNYTIPFFVWGPGVTPGGNLYELNPDLSNPGSAQPAFTSPTPPIRSSMVGNLALDLMDLPAIPGSCANVSQQLRVSSPPSFSSLYPELPPGGDANGNGFSNYFDYALGADPQGVNRPDLLPRMNGQYLVIHQRANIHDVAPGYEVSTDLMKWAPLLEGATILPLASEETTAGRRITMQVPTFGRSVYFRQTFQAPR